jgi:hypothetical protein
VTYSFTQDVPIDAAFYQRISDGVGPDRPTGMLLHLAIALPEGGLRYIDVWESEQDWQRFVDDHLHPVVHSLLSEIFGDQLPPEPAQVPLTIVHLWQ